MKQLILPFLFLILFTSSCATQKMLDQYSGTSIVFGDGGGFTGLVNEYKLTTDGRIILLKNMTGDTVTVATLNKKATANIYSKLKESGIDTLSFNHPGNKYYFIGKEKNNKTAKIVWGNRDYAVPQPVEDLYTLLISNINN